MRTFAWNRKASILPAAKATSPRILLASAVFSRFRHRQSPFVGSVRLNIRTLSNGRLHPFGGEGSVSQADAGQLHDRI